MTTIILTFLAAFLLSGIAAYYSVIGLAAIFVGAFWPVVFMGSTLEFAKLVTASWLYRNWHTAPVLLKTYLTIAVVILMLLTSMGIFGFLAKAHIDSTLDAGVNSVELKTLNQQEKISKEKLDYLLKRAGNPETASANIDRQIQQTQRELSDINKKRLPLLKEENKLIADVGPIKYVADMFFGDGEDALDKAVRMVILIIMLVFDPLAVLLLVAGNISLRQRKDAATISVPVSVPIDDVESEKTIQNVKESQSNTVEVPKENLTTITEMSLPEPHEVVIEHQAPGMYSETPVKKLEPKYDYDAEYAFREKDEKENK
jgi:hypothetical protein